MQTHVVRRAGKPQQKKRRSQGGKKRCERGAACPFQHEHQHLQEYHHDNNNNEQEKKRTVGVGHRLGGGGASKSSEVRKMTRQELCARAVDKRLQLSPVIDLTKE